VHRLTVDESPAHREVARRWARKQAVKGLRLVSGQIADGHEVQQSIVVESCDATEVSLAKLRSTRHDGLEHRLQRAGRTGDDL
jgi:hypothetical protein